MVYQGISPPPSLSSPLSLFFLFRQIFVVVLICVRGTSIPPVVPFLVLVLISILLLFLSVNSSLFHWMIDHWNGHREITSTIIQRHVSSQSPSPSLIILLLFSVSLECRPSVFSFDILPSLSLQSSILTSLSSPSADHCMQLCLQLNCPSARFDSTTRYSQLTFDLSHLSLSL